MLLLQDSLGVHHRGIGDLVYKKGVPVSSAAAFTISNLTNPKTANNTVMLNLNLSKRQGNAWLHIDAKGVSVRAVSDRNAKELKSDVLHLEANGVRAVADDRRAGASSVALDAACGLPMQIPPGTTDLEFRLDAADSYLREIHIFFTPL